MQAMCHIYAAISFICIDNAESFSKALELIGPVMGIIDSFVGVREKTSVFLAHGFLLMRQQSAQEARVKLAAGLQIAHNSLGNLQLVSQYLSVLGNLALSVHDTGQAREILRSSLTLAKKLYDLPTQVSVLSNLTALYKQLGEEGNESENREYQTKKLEELQKRLRHACSSNHHKELIAKVKTEVPEWSNCNTRRTTSNPTTGVYLDIPESIGLSTASPIPNSSSSRLMEVDLGRRLRKRNM
ncbi:unnamed protein product [Cuscuta campestris]|uniref:MalT-like TPR region domain-containing protein n=1 Tax=Cuscuta campestris TaxID=132261 RepID=A0A484L608_9ASTE|nr:unnamed protein product [Cuscuta campestris]